MTKVSEIYTGQFVNAAELPDGRRIAAVITAAGAQTVGQGDQATIKIVLDLKAPDGRPWPKSAVLNKSNAVLLAAVMGDDTTAWIGRSIEIWREKVMFAGRLVDGMRMAAAAPAANNGGAIPLSTPAAASSATAGTTGQHIDDEIPF